MDNDFFSRINAQIEELEKRIKSLSMQITTSAYNSTFKLCLDDIKDLISDFKDEFDNHLENCELFDSELAENIQTYTQALQDLTQIQDDVDALESAVSALQTSVANKLDKNTTTLSSARVYGQDASGNEEMYQISSVANSGYLVQRDYNGMFAVNTPTQNVHPASKGYVDNLFNGASKAISYTNYNALITAFNGFDETKFKVGQNIFVQTLDVPDLWVYAIADTSTAYTYTTDNAFVTSLLGDGYVQVGYYKLSYLESNKVDLTNYVTTDTNQNISGIKTFDSGIKIGNGSSTGDIILDSSSRVVIKYGSGEKLKVGSSDTLFANRVTPDSSNTYDLGRSGVFWKDLYLAGNLTDGTKSIAISNIAKKSSVAEYTLSCANWVNKEYTLSIVGKTSSNNAVVSNSNSGTTHQAVLDNANAIADANIYRIIDNGTSLTFVCETTPQVDLKIQVEVCE